MTYLSFSHSSRSTHLRLHLLQGKVHVTRTYPNCETATTPLHRIVERDRLIVKPRDRSIATRTFKWLLVFDVMQLRNSAPSIPEIQHRNFWLGFNSTWTDYNTSQCLDIYVYANFSTYVTLIFAYWLPVEVLPYFSIRLLPNNQKRI